MSEAPQIEYHNTDLDLVCASDLTPLTNVLSSLGLFAIGKKPDKGEDSQWYAILETCDFLDEPERTIGVMLDAIEALDGDAARLWAGCSKREMNIGYMCGDVPWAFNQGLSTSTVKRMASADVSLRVTIYPYRPT